MEKSVQGMTMEGAEFTALETGASLPETISRYFDGLKCRHLHEAVTDGVFLLSIMGSVLSSPSQ